MFHVLSVFLTYFIFHILFPSIFSFSQLLLLSYTFISFSCYALKVKLKQKSKREICIWNEMNSNIYEAKTLVSLMTTIHNIHNHPRLSTSLNKNQIESLVAKLDLLLDFVENHNSHAANKEAEVLEGQIAFVAHAAEDAIESHIVDQIEPLMAGSTFDNEETSSSLLLDLLVNIMQQLENHPRLLTCVDRNQIDSLGEKLDILLDFTQNPNFHVEDAVNCQMDAENYFLDLLIIILEQILNHPRFRTSFDKNKIESFGKEVTETTSDSDECISEEDLEIRIASAAVVAEDVIEPQVAAGSTFYREETSSRLLLDFLRNIMQHIENHPRSLDRKRVESLSEKLDFLLDFVENPNSHAGSKEAEVLENRDLVFNLLVFIMEQMLNHPRFWTSLEGKEIEVFGEVVDILQLFTETTYNSDGVICKEVVEDLYSPTTEYVIDSHEAAAASTLDHGETSSSSTLGLPNEINAMKKKVIQAHKKLFGKEVVFAGCQNSFLPGLQRIIEDMDSVKEMVVKFKEESRFKDLPPTYSAPVPSSEPLTTGKTSMIGFDGYLVQCLEWLTNDQSDLQIISLTGMGGIGKTTLARHVYEDLRVVQHFDVCAWFTVSQECNVREMLFLALSVVLL